MSAIVTEVSEPATPIGYSRYMRVRIMQAEVLSHTLYCSCTTNTIQHCCEPSGAATLLCRAAPPSAHCLLNMYTRTALVLLSGPESSDIPRSTREREREREGRAFAFVARGCQLINPYGDWIPL